MTRKNLNYSDRLAIETMLDEGRTVSEISKDIQRPASGIVKEIEKHSINKYPSEYNRSHPCLKFKTCSVRSSNCYEYCKNIEYKVCPSLLKSPHVCNGCTTKTWCRYVKKYYNARDAHEEFKKILSNSRKGLQYNEHELLILNERLLPLILRCKSVYHSV